MVIAGLVFAALAAVLHVYIFVMESLTWTSPRTRATFGTTAETAEITKELAFNQGFYNLFLAIGALLGLVLLGTGLTQAGLAIAIFSCASMVGAALVLVGSSPKLWRAALLQGAAPLIGVVLLLLGLAV